MDGIVLDDIVDDTDLSIELISNHILFYKKEAEVMSSSHNRMSRIHYMTFISSTFAIQIISIGMSISIVLTLPITIPIIGSAVILLISGLLQTFDVSSKAKLHRILAKHYNKIKLFASLDNKHNSKRIFKAIQVLKNEINSIEDIHIPSKIVLWYRSISRSEPTFRNKKKSDASSPLELSASS